MKKILLLLTIAVLYQALSGQENMVSIYDIEFYRKQNENETRLKEFADSDENLALKVRQLELINRSRKKYKAPPVMLDILASRVANKMCREAAVNGFISHWNMAGEKPYHRYAFAGGLDHVSENAYGEWTSGNYDNSPSTVAEMMEEGHLGFMKEKAPYDGHKKNIIDRNHNYVGLGFYISEGQFRYYEEFINRYIHFISVPTEAKINEQVNIVVDTKGNGFLYFMTVYRENFPKQMSVSHLSKTGSYQDYSEENYANIPAWDISPHRKGTIYSIPLKLTKEGLYYIQLFTDTKENTGNMAVSTKGKPPVSGIVIRVSR